MRRRRRFHVRHIRAYDDHNPLRFDRRRGVENVPEQRAAGDRMQNLRARGLHPRPFTGRQNDDRGFRLTHRVIPESSAPRCR